MKHSRYPSYRDSEVEWLGKVPEHWQMSKLKYDSYIKARVGWHGLTSDELFEDGDAYAVTGSDFLGNAVNWEDCRKCTLERYKQDRFIQLQDDDLLVTKDGTIGKIIKVNKLPNIATLNGGIFVIRPLQSKYNTTYYYWLLVSSVFHGFVSYYKTGSTISHLYQDTFCQMPYALPPLQEQQTIANYLNKAIAKIDTLVEKQTKLVELLKEKQQAVISTAVTRGLDSTVAMKDSGIEWLGEIPVSWKLPKISYIGSVTNGSTPDKSNKEYWTNGTIPWLASGCLNIDKVVEPTGLISDNAYNSCSVELIPSGSLLVGMVGQGKTRGTSALLGIDACINQNLAAIIPSNIIQVQFLHFLFQTMYISLREAGRGSNQAALNCDIIKSIRIPFPTMQEQEQVSQYISDKIQKIDNLITKSIKAIDLLKEKRTALISSAVTGKIDVRGEVA